MNEAHALPLQFGGVVPSLAQVADLGPPRSELGVGCLMPWQGKLYVQNYVSHTRASGTGSGLRTIDADFVMVRDPQGADGTYANRMVHHPSNQLIIGPHVVDPRPARADHRGVQGGSVGWNGRTPHRP